MVIGLAMTALRGLAGSGLARGIAAGVGKLVPSGAGGWGGAIAGTGAYIVGGELLKNTVANPILRATGLGQPAYQAHPAAAPGALPPGMTPLSGGGMGYGRYGVMGGGYATGFPTPGAVNSEQFDYLYGNQGWFGTGINRQEGLYERYRNQEIAAGQKQLETQIQGQRDLANIGQEGASTRARIASGQNRYLGELNRDVAMRGYGAQESIAGMGYQAQRYLSDNAARLGEIGYSTQKDISRMGYDTQRDIAQTGYATQKSIVDMTTSRQLAGLRDTNMAQLGLAGIASRTQLGVANIGAGRDVALADRQLSSVYDTNRRDVTIAGIGANRDRYVADRSVEVARWGGSMPRIAMFGQLMRR